MNLITFLVLVALPVVFAWWMRMESEEFERQPAGARGGKTVHAGRKD